MEGTRIKHRFQGPQLLSSAESSENAVTLRLLAIGAERPNINFGNCVPGSKKEALLQLLNETELERVLTLEKLPPGISVIDEDESSPDTYSVPRRSSRIVRVCWCPDGAAAVLHDSLRWRMTEGLRQARLEVRLQGVTSELPTPARSSRTAAPPATKISDMRVPNKYPAAPSIVSKAPPRALSLARPPLATAAVFPAQNQEVPRRVGVLEPAPINAPAPSVTSTRLPVTTPTASPQPGSSARAFSARHAVSPPTRLCSTLESSKALDFRRVGCAENKRERALISWMNSEVAPLGTAASVAGGSGVEGHQVRRLLGEVTGKAYTYFKRDEGFAAMASKLEAKIAAKQLVIRDAEHTLSDVRMRQQALEVLTSYHPFWLAVGLQTVLGRALVFTHGNMVALMRPGIEVPAFIRTHILEHLLADQNLAAQFRHVAFKQEYWEALGARVLGRVLLLVLLLDRLAQRCDLPAGAPPLFRHEANIKSSEQVVQEFLQTRLAGAGDVRHSLRMMTYSTEYVQHARDEADFRVRKPLDLRDGTRLAKLLDNLRRQAAAHPNNGSQPAHSVQSSQSLASAIGTSRLAAAACSSRVPVPDEDLLPSMAFPQNTGKPMDESQMRNNCLRLVRALQQHGLTLQGLVHGAPVGLRDPVSGDNGVAKSLAEGLLRVDQRVTLGMLWQIAMHFKLRRHVDARSLERETARLRRMAAAAAGTAGDAGQQATILSAEDDVALRYFNDPTSQALLQWMRAVCAPSGISINNFTWSLSDGRALCYLIHTYMPEALPQSRIASPELPASADEMARMTGGTEYVTLETLRTNGWTVVYEMGGTIHDNALAAAYKQFVDANFAAAHAAGEALGVPAMLSAEDYLNDGPDELAAILYVALLSEALLKLTAERRAAYVIMEYLRRRLCWRPSYMHASLERFKVVMRRTEAALTIQSFMRMRRQRMRYLAHRRAICVLQAFSRRWLVHRHLELQTHSATVLQAAWRGFVVRLQLRRERRAATLLQASWRGIAARRALARLLNATLTIQRYFRKYLASHRRLHERLVASRTNAAVQIQSAWRAHVARRHFLQLRAAAVSIQTFVRMHWELQRYQDARRAAIVLQLAWRRRQAQLSHAAHVRAAVCIQTLWRRFVAVRKLAEARVQVIRIQACYRGFLARREASARWAAVVRIQALWRAVLACRLAEARRSELQNALQNRAATVLQAVVRGHLMRQKLTACSRAATVIQACWRMGSARRRHNAMRHAAVVVQAAVRSWLVQRRLNAHHSAATTIQSLWRRRSAMLAFAEARNAANTIAWAWRAWRERERFLALRRAAVQLQALWRVHAARQEFLRIRSAAVIVRAVWRGWRDRKAYRRLHAATTVIQSSWRARVAQKLFNRLRTAAITIQAAVRCRLARVKYLRVLQAAAVIQATWRARQLRVELQLQRNAATAIQAAWRARLARRAYERQQQAAVVLQAAFRRNRAMRQLERVRAAAQLFQGLWRGLLARREMARRAEAFYTDLRRQQEERLLEIARHFILRSAAAKKIQAWWRGHMARRAVGPVLRLRKQMARQQRAAVVIQSAWRGCIARTAYRRMRIALVVISQTLVPIFRARQQLRRLRAAFQARVQAAIVLQAGVRLWLARRRLVLTVSAATKIQAAWRGHAVRRRAGWHKQEARRRLEQAALEARTAPHRHIGYRTREALEMLARHTKNLTQVVAAVEVIEVSTRYSRDCCDLIAQHGGLEALLQLVRSCNRSMPCQDVFDRTLAILSNICRHKALVSEVMHANGCLAALTERMQYFREEEEMFNPLVTLLQRLTATDALATDVPPSVTKSWEGILQLLQRTFEREKKYLERLEVQKGSDVSARESARKVVVVQQQIQSLELLINRCQTAKDEGPAAPDSARDKDKDQDKDATRKQATAGGKTATSVLAAQPPIPGYKNTLVKEAVRGMASGGHAPNTLNKATGVKRSGGGVTSSPVQPGKGSRPFNRRMDAS